VPRGYERRSAAQTIELLVRRVAVVRKANHRFSRKAFIASPRAEVLWFELRTQPPTRGLPRIALTAILLNTVCLIGIPFGTSVNNSGRATYVDAES
jgi:hypothetical protein